MGNGEVGLTSLVVVVVCCCLSCSFFLGFRRNVASEIVGVCHGQCSCTDQWFKRYVPGCVGFVAEHSLTLLCCFCCGLLF